MKILHEEFQQVKPHAESIVLFNATFVYENVMV